MRFRSLEKFGLSPLRLCVVAGLASAGSSALFTVVVGGALGGATAEVEAIVAATAAYIILSTPKRLLSAAALSQAREALILSAASVACMRVTGSRSRTFLMLDSRDEGVSQALGDIKRRLLLGEDSGQAARRAVEGLSSYSAGSVLTSLATARQDRSYEEGEEASGLEQYSELAQETRLPVFLAVCFFTPIMLLLYLMFAGVSDPVSLAELFGFEVIVLDLTFYLCSTGGRLID